MTPGLDRIFIFLHSSLSYGYAYCARTMRKSIPKHEMPDTPLPANVVKVRRNEKEAGQDKASPRRINAFQKTALIHAFSSDLYLPLPTIFRP